MIDIQIDGVIGFYALVDIFVCSVHVRNEFMFKIPLSVFGEHVYLYVCKSIHTSLFVVPVVLLARSKSNW